MYSLNNSTTGQWLMSRHIHHMSQEQVLFHRFATGSMVIKGPYSLPLCVFTTGSELSVQRLIV